MHETHESEYESYVRLKRERFYADMLGMKVSLSSIDISERPLDVTVPLMLIIVHQGLHEHFKKFPIERLFRLSRSFYGGKSYIGDRLDRVITCHDRSPEEGSYAIWVENRVEVAPPALTPVKEKWHANETILERLLHGLYFSWKSRGMHLDMSEGTLCEASRDKEGGIPFVDFHEGVRVKIVDSQERNRFLRPRKIWL